MFRIDMHTHSRCSDGLFSVRQLVTRAKRDKVSVLSLTDHDTVEGLQEFIPCCKELGIAPLTGIELSAKSKYTLHILGYRFDFRSQALRDTLVKVRAMRDARNVLICERLQSLGLDVAMEDVLCEAGGGVVARPHFARALVARGYVADVASAFSRYLADGRPAYIARDSLSAEQCIQAIRDAGGVAVLAHPHQTGLPQEAMEALLGRLKESGLWGLECITPHHTPKLENKYFEMARKFELQPTAGSDFHSDARGGIGVLIEENFLPWARLGLRLS